MPAIHGRVSKANFQHVINRVDKRLAGWKTKCLSLAGRMTLIQATVTAIPAYTMQSVKLPRSVCDELDRKLQRFLWGGSSMQRKPHLVAWNAITKEKSQGGLGIRCMRDLNSAYLMKLGWRFLSEPTALWARILKEKYCRGRDVTIRMDRKASCSNAWRGIMDMKEISSWGAGVAVGDGRHTKFWLHRWVGGKVLQEHAMTPIPDDQLHRLVCEFWDPGRGWRWAEFEPLLPPDIVQQIASYELTTDDVGDRAVWVADKSGKFTIKSAVSLLRA